MADTRIKHNTFQGYLERAEAAGVIDFALRIQRTPEGLLDFYIHPANASGETADFTVCGAFVLKLEIGAGSSRRIVRRNDGASSNG